MKFILLHHKDGSISGKTIVDDIDYEWASQWRWYQTNKGYVVRGVSTSQNQIRLHREIASRCCLDLSKTIDHVNHNTLDNRRGNLRSANSRQQTLNQRKRQDASSKYIGVSWDKTRGRWKVQLEVNGTVVYSGRFLNEREAAEARDQAIMSLTPSQDLEFIMLNFPKD